MSLPFLLEIGTEEIPDWMIRAGARKPARLLFAKSRRNTLGDESVRRMPRRAAWCCAPTDSLERQPDTEERVSGPPKSAPAQALRRLRARSRASSPKSCTVETTAKGEYYSLSKKVAGPPSRGHPRRGAAGHHPADLLPEDDVLDRQGRPALHPAHPLDRRAARRRIVPFELAGVRSGDLDRRPPPSSARARSPSPSPTTSRRLRDQLRDPLAPRAPRAESKPSVARRRQAKPITGRCPARNAGLPHRISHADPGSFDRSTWSCPRKCWSP